MTELGLETGFQFQRGSYGPFTNEMQQALTILANANLIREEQLGKMTALLPGTAYQMSRDTLLPRLKPFSKEIDKTVDLFSRIKNTEQAEVVTTVFYATRMLKQEYGQHNASKQDVLDFISLGSGNHPAAAGGGSRPPWLKCIYATRSQPQPARRVYHQ